VRAGHPGEELAAEADAHERLATVQCLPHEVVLARNGVPATGSPWWIDSLNVLPGETYDIAFLANNPGIWMDHCHNLKHAAQGMIAHLMYEGFDTPYRIAGPAANQPE